MKVQYYVAYITNNPYLLSKIFNCARPDASSGSGVNTPPGLRSFNEGRLKGFPRALEDILRPCFVKTSQGRQGVYS